MSLNYEIPHGDRPPSYHNWQYADEASLYSIAEDSRENGSDVFSVTEAAPEIPAFVMQPDVKWVQEDILKNEEEINGPSHSGMKDVFQRLLRNKWIKLGLAGLLLLVAVLAIAIGVRASNSDTKAVPDSIEVGAEAPEDVPVDIPVAVPSASPTSSASSSFPTQQPSLDSSVVTASPTQLAPYDLATKFVTNALSACADSSLLQDKTFPQGRIFEKLVLELLEEITVDADGFVYYPLDYGDAFIKEKFGLEMLYEATNGDTWNNNINWKTENDPCAGWNGVQNCRPRREGSCGVVEIDLAFNNLSGYIPPELCCLPCLEILNLSNNLLAGDTPGCLKSGVSLTLDNNVYLNAESAQVNSSP
ncbi:hypothetical protein FisN_12Hh292 [Fistulifera solaris]|uniref:Uncharacterized protein n=1 Tax=Fistulifera solaris TaxID=1519565 RepID=A0A1Z5KC37_FISSO|nr:hypothetical protein FisN_12Hh292 [Fistulifera solaris]|eukprot:GAX23715.1 hypothetical protein FisN_12Hh292 [Fistulifera solaris]